jgi:tetratricopeptide (TPR) repeat protein
MFHHWDWNTAEKELDRALELNPNSAVAHHWKGVYLSLRGRLDEAKTELQRALELDPVSLIIMADLGQLHYFAHEYDQAINYCNRALALDPDFLVAHQYLLDIYHAKGMNDAVFNELLYLQHRYSTTEVKQQFRDTFTRGGVRAVTEQEINLRSNEKGVGLLMARLYSRIGDKERALYWLDRAVSEERLFWTAYINVDPLFDPLHADGRFKAIVSRMGLS